MIALTFDIGTKVARLSGTTAIKVGADVPVKVTFSAAPGEVSSIQFALGTTDKVPEVLAFTEDFSAESATVWTALLDATDTRLVEFMQNLPAQTVAGELVCVIDGERLVAPSVSVSVQPAIINGPEESEGGPSYFTDAQVTAAIAAAFLIARGITYQAAALTAAGTTNVALLESNVHIDFTLVVSAGAGAGAYTRVIVLPTTGRLAGDRVTARLSVVASPNPTIEFRADAAAGALILDPENVGVTKTGDADEARIYELLFVYTGAAWVAVRNVILPS